MSEAAETTDERFRCHFSGHGSRFEFEFFDGAESGAIGWASSPREVEEFYEHFKRERERNVGERKAIIRDEEALVVAKELWEYCAWCMVSGGTTAPEWSDDEKWEFRSLAISIGRAAIHAVRGLNAA